MAEDQAEDVDASASEEPKKKKGGKKKLIIIAAVVVLVGVGAYWFLLKPGGSAGASGCPPTTLPGWQPASAKQLEAAKAATKTSPPGEAGNTSQTSKPEGSSKPNCEPPEPPKPGAVVKVEPMTISLADGSYLKVGLGLQLAEGGGDPKEWTETNRGLRAQNVAVRVLGARTAAQLAPGLPRDEAQAELKRQVAVAFASEDGTKSEVIDVLFTEFVMQ